MNKELLIAQSVFTKVSRWINHICRSTLPMLWSVEYAVLVQKWPY